MKKNFCMFFIACLCLFANYTFADQDTSHSSKRGILATLLNDEEVLDGDINHGEKIYKSKCQHCHGIDANKGYLSKALNELSKPDIYKALRSYKRNNQYGKSGKFQMQIVAKSLSIHDMISVSAYIYSIKNSYQEASKSIAELNMQKEDQKEEKKEQKGVQGTYLK